MTALFDNQRIQFQTDLDAIHPGGSLELSCQEYPVPLVVRRSLTIEGHGATLWALKGPVLIIEAGAQVHLRNLRVEVTGEGMTMTPEEEAAIRVAPGGQVDLDDVEVRGAIEGLPQEAGIWRYPKTMYLGPMSPSAPHEFRVRIATATPCKISSQVSGIDVSPSTLPGGKVELRLKVEQLRNDTFLYGRILLKTAFSKRWIVVSGHVSDATGSPSPPGGQHAPMLWEPPDWDSLSAPGQTTAAAPPTAAPPQPVAPPKPAATPAQVAPPAPVPVAAVAPSPVSVPVAPIAVVPPVQPVSPPPAQPQVPPPVVSTPPTAAPQLPLSASTPLQISPAPVSPVARPPLNPSLPVSPPRPPGMRHQDPSKLGIFSKPQSLPKAPDATPATPASSTPKTKSDSLPKWAKSSAPFPPVQSNVSTPAPVSPPSAPVIATPVIPTPVTLTPPSSAPLTIAFATDPAKGKTSPPAPPAPVQPPAPATLTLPTSAPLTIAFATDPTKASPPPSVPPAPVKPPAPKPDPPPSLFPPLTIAFAKNPQKPGTPPPKPPAHE